MGFKIKRAVNKYDLSATHYDPISITAGGFSSTASSYPFKAQFNPIHAGKTAFFYITGDASELAVFSTKGVLTDTITSDNWIYIGHAVIDGTGQAGPVYASVVGLADVGCLCYACDLVTSNGQEVVVS